MIGSRKKNCRFFNLLLMTLLFAASSHVALGQVTAAVSGRIEDPSGAAIPDATVVVTNAETQATRTVPTDPAGNYRVLSLPVGRYEIRAEKPGFKAAVQKGITLVVGQEAVISLKLEVGEVQQEVTVTGEAPLVNTTTASVSGLVGERQVKDLPLNGRSFDNLITLNPGAVNYTNKNGPISGNGEGNYFTVAGRRPAENLFLLNGVEYTGNSQIGVTPGGVSGQLMGIDAVREFNVLSSAYSAEYGKRPGAQVSIVTQSGTNQVHGTAFEFLRNSVLDARNFFDYPATLRIPPFKRNQFGGSLGGPIRRDKTFVFGNYEGFRQRLGLSSVAIVPDANARRGLLPDAQGVPTPVTGLNPAMLPYMAFWPEPNGTNLGGGAALAFANPNQTVREDFGTMRLDHTFSSKDTVSGAYTIDDGYNLTPTADFLFAAVVTLRSQVASLEETHVFSPQWINTATVGFSRGAFLYDNPPLVPLPASLSFAQGKPPGTITVGGGTATGASTITSAGASNTPHAQDERNLFTYTDGVQLVHGKHQVSLGAWFERVQSNVAGASRAFGQATFTNLQTFLQGTVATFTAVPNPTPMGWRSLQGAWYAQDSIQLRPNLTLRLGLRHEFTTGWNEWTGRAANFLYDANGVLLTDTLKGSSALTQNNSKWLFSPRVGLAWDPFGKGKTSIRAGFGTYYDLLDTLGFILKDVPPYNGTISYANVPLLPLLPIVPGLPLRPACGPTVPPPCTTYAPQGVQPNLKWPTVESWNFTVEQQLSPNTALRLAYVGSREFHEIVSIDPNAIPSRICSDAGGCASGGIGSTRGTVPQGALYIPVGTRPNPYLSNGFFWFSEGNTFYSALQVDVTRRIARGLQFRANYTWAKNLDIGSGVSASQSINQAQMVLNPYNIFRDWGPSALNITHQVGGSFGYELPIGHGQRWLKAVTGVSDKLLSGWEMNGIVSVLSGFPLTPQVGSNRSGDGDARNPDRPSVNPAVSGSSIIGSPNRWFDPKAYILPVAGTYGDLGRGTLEGPGLATLDLSLFKSTPISERFGLQFRAEFFNILNRANFGTPNPIVFTGTGINSSAGVITNTATTSRQIQFGLKLMF